VVIISVFVCYSYNNPNMNPVGSQKTNRANKTTEYSVDNSVVPQAKDSQVASNGVKKLNQEQSGFILLIVCLIVILLTVVYLVYNRVATVGQ
jgi:hypothetical protein